MLPLFMVAASAGPRCLVFALTLGLVGSVVEPALADSAELAPRPVPSTSPAPLSQTPNMFERVPAASWAMGCAAGAALAAHAVYQSLSDRRKARLESRCADYCPEYRIDHYQETRRKADIALRLSVLAGASAVWLLYNDPNRALQHVMQRTKPKRSRGLSVHVKPQKRGVWASLVARF